MIDYSARIAPGNITELKPNEVFVFGSNLAGRHGKGAAKQALQWGAKHGDGNSYNGQTYAIPTKDVRIRTLHLDIIELHVKSFLLFCVGMKSKTFLVTEIGCGLAGYTPEQIAPLFRGAIDLPNVHLPKRFWEVLLKD